MSCFINKVKSTINSRFQVNFLYVHQFSFCNQTLFEEGEAMAAALVGGSILSAFLQVLFDRMASREVLDFFKERNLNERLLKKLKIMMISVNGVLDDAEEKQVTKPAVKEWLDELKDTVYEADDLLDEIAYEALRLESFHEFLGQSMLQIQILSQLSDYFEDETSCMAKLEWQFWRDKADHLPTAITTYVQQPRCSNNEVTLDLS
ncbi:hypothetical protein NC651_000378, partial [Populus alba x Populus x berolinensis]